MSKAVIYKLRGIYAMRRFACALVLLMVPAVLAGCGTSRHHGSTDDAGGLMAKPATIIYSPNGEPLNGGPIGRIACGDAEGRWFDRVDADHNGTISRDEFMADAKLQFQRMDIDHNGYLVSEELERYRLPYRQAATSQIASSTDTSGQSSEQHKHRHGGGDQSGSGQSTPDPVMSADANNDFKVTPDEFMAQAARKFAELDTAHTGILSRGAVLKMSCEKPAAH